ncbi:MAG TPA: PAS domain-containing sensor histidine kinase [Vitreimonas sp.]|uniref:sensor histidine kinase NtrY-like n=1 Tax=Vitreimonas sp. TaxID=3069702 RepID=UPI002D52EC07|nr:PAS domain-containing sensor histidine kinase [Vitreimonas sp.]HYD87461.1 PAS domain-containing sensor histidine kinase [Vitreimonas sp.]
MVHHITAADEPAETAVLSDRPQGKSALLFLVGLGLAIFLTGSATIALLLGEGLAGGASGTIRGLLIASLVISAGLAGILLHRLMRVARAWRSSATGARLHVRFVTLFSLAALAPALIVAAFLGFTFSQGVERWFSQRVETTIENAANVGRAYVDLASGGITGEVEAMAVDLNLAQRGLVEEPDVYLSFLAAQAERRDLVSAYVIDSAGSVLARAERAGAVGYAPPSAQAFETANAGDVFVRFDQEHDRVLALHRLSAYDGAYVWVSRAVEPGLVAQLRAFDNSVEDYRNAREQQGTLRGLFGLAYFSTALIVLLAAGWVGLTSASRVAEPIGRLVGAARRVASGDLKARVATGDDRDEIDALAGAFNSMTAQLETQRRDLVRAQEDAEKRSQFIETVLGGVSAGVVGLDRDGRITASNRSAGQLLGHGQERIVGRRLVDIAPEFSDLLNQPAPAGETPPQRVDLVREGGSLNLSVRMSPDASGGLVLTFDDMTKLISAQRQEAWKDVARRIAHEIKNPLTPIQLSAERLRRKYAGEIVSDQDTFLKCTDTILRQVADIGRMVDEFSSFARMPTPKMSFADMSDVARSTVFGQRLAFADLRIEVEGVDKPIGLVVDERLISQALLNLIKNAAESVQARRARDGEPKDGFVLLRLRDLDFGVQFEVIDNGLGFPEKDRHRLIEPYVTTRTKGAGLGLAIVARIVEDHGGLIELDDAPGPGPGAVVRFVLPKRGEEPVEPAADQGAGAS